MATQVPACYHLDPLATWFRIRDCAVPDPAPPEQEGRVLYGPTGGCSQESALHRWKSGSDVADPRALRVRLCSVCAKRCPHLNDSAPCILGLSPIASAFSLLCIVPLRT